MSIKNSNIDDDRHWLQIAIEEAQGSGADVPVGAVIVLGGEIIGRGGNRREATGDPTAHAEIVAIRQATSQQGGWRLTGSTVYTTLEPCAMCAEAIIQARVARLVFGAYDPAAGACGSFFNLFVSGRTLPIPEVVGGLLEEACLKLVVEFFRHKSQN